MAKCVCEFNARIRTHHSKPRLKLAIAYDVAALTRALCTYVHLTACVAYNTTLAATKLTSAGDTSTMSSARNCREDCLSKGHFAIQLCKTRYTRRADKLQDITPLRKQSLRGSWMPRPG